MTLDDVKSELKQLRWHDSHDDVDQKQTLFPRSCRPSIINKMWWLEHGRLFQLLYIQVNPRSGKN